MLIGSALPLPMLFHSMVSVISWDPSPVPARQFLFSTAPGTKQSSFNVKLVAEILSVMYVPKSQGPSEFQTCKNGLSMSIKIFGISIPQPLTSTTCTAHVVNPPSPPERPPPCRAPNRPERAHVPGRWRRRQRRSSAISR